MSARDNRLFDDIARVAGGAAGLLASVRQQAAEEIRARIDEMAERVDLVPRADLERAEAMIAALEKRVSALEGGKVKQAGNRPAKKTAPKKPAAKKTAAKKTPKKK